VWRGGEVEPTSLATSENPLSSLSLIYHSALMSPTNMSEDWLIEEPNCVSALEQAVDDMRSDAQATRQLLQDILQ